MNMTDRRRTVSPTYHCWWCNAETDAETGYRGYDPDDAVMADFGATVSAIVCGPTCPGRPARGVVHARPRWGRAA